MGEEKVGDGGKAADGGEEFDQPREGDEPDQGDDGGLEKAARVHLVSMVLVWEAADLMSRVWDRFKGDLRQCLHKRYGRVY